MSTFGTPESVYEDNARKNAFDKKHKASRSKALEKKKGGKESYSDLLKRTKGMGWFEAGQEHMKHMGHKQKDLQTKEQYKKMIDNAKAYD